MSAQKEESVPGSCQGGGPDPRGCYSRDRRGGEDEVFRQDKYRGRAEVQKSTMKVALRRKGVTKE